MSSGERPIGAAKGNQSDTEALCHPPRPPPPTPCPLLCLGLAQCPGPTCASPCAADYTFLFNACPRGSGIPYNNAVNGGAVTRAVCEAKCNADPACRVIEMAGCSAGGCVGQCMLYRGSEGGEIRNGGCTTDGSMKSFLKPTSVCGGAGAGGRGGACA